MKKLIIMVILVMTLSLLLSATKELSFTSSNKGISMVSQKSDKIVLDMNVGEMILTDVNTKGGQFTDLFIPGFSWTSEAGLPKLPFTSKIIAVPVNAVISVNIINSNYRVVSLNQQGFSSKVVPTQPSVAKNIDLETVPFEYNTVAYEKSSYENHSNVKVEEIGFMRGYRLALVSYTPVEYNPLENQMKVYEQVRVEIGFEEADHNQTEYLKASHYSPMFETVLAQNILNYTPPVNRDALTRMPVKYVIISDPMFQAQLQPFIEWKTMQGFHVIEKYKGDPQVGSTKESIKAYLQGLWDAATEADPAPTYLLIVGDHTQIPAWTGNTGSDHITDLTYVRLNGTDFLPEMYYGRFSANNTNELQPQIDKTLYYEKYEITDPTYLGKAVLIAGVDPTFGPKHANAQINYASTEYFNAEHGITPFIHLYPGSGSQDAAIISEVSQGVGYANYTAHGDWDGWSDPSFNNSNVTSLQNNGKYAFMVGNCCLTNKFQQTSCFGETLLRAVNKGAIGYIGGTNVSYWDEDYWWGVGYTGSSPQNGNTVPYNANQLGMYDKLFHSHGEAYANWYTSADQIIYSGNLAVQQSSSSRKNYYWEIYSLMGDPSLVPYMRIPDENPATYLTTLFVGLDTFNINNATPYTFASLTMDGVIKGTGVTDENGNLSMIIDPVTIPGTAQLVLSAQNNVPVIADIQVVPNEGAYIVYNSCQVGLTGNNTLDYNSNSPLTVSVRNVGSENAANLTAIVRSLTSYISVSDSLATVTGIEPNGNYTFNSEFQIVSSAYAPDNAQANMELIVSDNNGHSWSSPFSLVINAPLIQGGTITLNDAAGNNNGRLDPGETVILTIPVLNNGHAVSQNGNMHVVSLHPQVTVAQNDYPVSGIPASQNTSVTVSVTAGASVPTGSLANIGYFVDLTSHHYQANYALPVGLKVESFETGNFNAYPWVLGTPAWTVVNTDAFDGTYCAKSGTISHNGTTVITVVDTATVAGTVKFACKVSSEEDYDKLEFYIDNVLKEDWSGEVGWTEVQYNVNVGTHTYKWQYKKDTSVSNGSDCAWIDQIVFPAAGGNVANAPMAFVNLNALNFGTVNIGQSATREFVIVNYGTTALNCMFANVPGYSINPSSPVSIAPQSNQVMSVTFTPTEAMAYNGVLTVTTNDETNPVFTININGSALGNNDQPQLPKVTKLNTNYPNPFNPETTISFDLKENSDVKISIYNIKGQLVKTLVDRPMNAGRHQLVWNGKDHNQQRVSSGVYFFRMDSKNYHSTKKMLLMK